MWWERFQTILFLFLEVLTIFFSLHDNSRTLLLSHILSISLLSVWKQCFTYTFTVNHYFGLSLFFLETRILILLLPPLVLHGVTLTKERSSVWLTAMKNRSEERSCCNWHHDRVFITQNLFHSSSSCFPSCTESYSFIVYTCSPEIDVGKKMGDHLTWMAVSMEREKEK